jgi:hypothetical protein
MPDLNEIHATVTPWKLDQFFELPEVPEPSGLCYCPLTNTMFVVDDGAEDRPSGLYELDLDCKLLRGIKLGKDLEGVCYCGAKHLLYVCDEDNETVHIVEPKELKVQGSFQVSGKWRLMEHEVLKEGGNGFEGIEWISEHSLNDPFDVGSYRLGSLCLLNQDDPTELVWLDVQRCNPGKTVNIEAITNLPQRNSGELYYSHESHELWVVNSWLNTVAIMDVDDIDPTNPDSFFNWPVKRWEVMPGMAQEGVAFDLQGRLWIGQDAGGIARYVKHT